MIKHKFHAVRTENNGIKFASKKEAKRYAELLSLKNLGQIQLLLLQTPFYLPGSVKYVCDFFVVWSNGDITIEDVKGFKTPLYIAKKKMTESIYGITITEI